MNKYQVVVGNLGTVYDGDNSFAAEKNFQEYVKISNNDYGRVSNEPVTLFVDGEPEAEFDGNNADCKDCEYMHLRGSENGHCYMFKDKPEGRCAQFITLFPAK